MALGITGAQQKESWSTNRSTGIMVIEPKRRYEFGNECNVIDAVSKTARTACFARDTHTTDLVNIAVSSTYRALNSLDA